MKQIIGLGSALIDILAPIPSDDLIESAGLQKGGMILIDEERKNLLHKLFEKYYISEAVGGSAGNTIGGLAKLGVKTGFIGKIGNDRLGKLYQTTQRAEGTAPYLLYDETATGCAMTLISGDGERTFGTFLGAAATLHAEDIPKEAFEGEYDTLFMEGYLVAVDEGRLVLRAASLAKQAGIKVALDMASYNMVEQTRPFLTDLIENYVDIVFANEEEAFAYTGLHEEAAAIAIARQCEIAVVKLGPGGAIAASLDGVFREPAIPATRIDTTGAGDLFAAGFLYGQTRNATLRESLQLGNIVAAPVIEVIGTRMGDSVWEKIKLNIAEIID